MIDLGQERRKIGSKLWSKGERINGEFKLYTDEELKNLYWEYEKLTQQIIDQEQECNHLCFVEEKIKTYKYELLGNKKIDEIYLDMCPNYCKGYPSIFSCYLYVGIQRMDSWLSKQIQLREKCKFTPKQISEMIKYNYHLHNVIKTNLLENLKTYSGEDYL